MNLQEPIKATENDLFILVHDISRTTQYIKIKLKEVGYLDYRTQLKDVDLEKAMDFMRAVSSSVTQIDKSLDRFYVKCYPKPEKT